MRIAILGDGTLNHVRRWAGYFHDRGHEVLLLSFERTPDVPFASRRLWKLLPTRTAGYAAAAGGIRSILAGFRPDIVNAIYAGGYGFAAALAGTGPLVVSAIGSDLLVDYPSSVFHRLQIGFALRRADLVTTDARVLTEAAVSAGARRDRVIEVVMGIDERIFHPPSGGGPGEGDIVIISTRNLHPVYDVGTMLDAFDLLAEDTGCRLVVCGDGPLRKDLEERAASSAAPRKIEFTGRLEPTELAGRLRSSDLYVSTSLSDSTSVSLLEAMACGAIPVVTDLPANREWIADGVNGYLFRPGDPASLAGALGKAAADGGEEMVSRNLEAVRDRGSWSRNMAAAEEAFERLAGSVG